MSNPFENREEAANTNAFFAIVVDNEVTYLHVVNLSVEGMVAAFSSDPKIVRLTNEQVVQVMPGWTYDGSNFNPPA